MTQDIKRGNNNDDENVDDDDDDDVELLSYPAFVFLSCCFCNEIISLKNAQLWRSSQLIGSMNQLSFSVG